MKKYLAALLLLTACEPIRSSTTSPIQGAEGVEDGKMHIMFESYGSSASATAVATDGEIFKGNVVTYRDQTETRSYGSATKLYKDKNGKMKTRSVSDDSTTYGDNYYGDAKGVFIGNRGHSMDCDFALTEPSSGIAQGGVGNCIISDGRVVPVSFRRVN